MFNQNIASFSLYISHIKNKLKISAFLFVFVIYIYYYLAQSSFSGRYYITV